MPESVDQDVSRPILAQRSVDSVRPLKVIVIGAGVSGILAAIRLPQRLKDLELVVYDKNEEIGGTWFENRYPGVACDIPSHCYQLTFESNPSWSSFYASGPEILAYYKRVVEKYGLRKYMRLGYKVLEAHWDSKASKWIVKLENTKTGDILEDRADALYQGIGTLNEWQWPKIEGLHDFEGKLMHTAQWDTSYDYRGKKVALIGAGSSGIQVAPAIQPHVARLDHYIRGRTWISTPFLEEELNTRVEDGTNFKYTREEIAAWKRDPKLYLKYRRKLENELQTGFGVTHKNHKLSKEAQQKFTGLMKARTKKKSYIAEHTIPTFPPGCKRLTPGPGYLESLTEGNVDVIVDPIARITPTGIVTKDGKQRDVDAIACATGFDTSFQNRFPLYGINGVKLSEKWKERPDSYLTMTTDGFPNFFMSLGPNSAVGHGNLLIQMEGFAEYTAKALEKMQTENILTMQPSARAVANFTDFCDEYFKDTVFGEECSSWYKAGKKTGRVSALWPGSSLHAMQVLKRPRWEDFEYTYVEGNEWGWFGDGWSRMDRYDELDKTYYLTYEPRMIDDPLEDGERMKSEDGPEEVANSVAETNGLRGTKRGKLKTGL